MKNRNYHTYTIRADEKPGWETTAANLPDAHAECRFLARKGFRPRATFQKSPDHSPIAIPVLVSPSGSVEFGQFDNL
jgi:hypothetical protein